MDVLLIKNLTIEIEDGFEKKHAYYDCDTLLFSTLQTTLYRGQWKGPELCGYVKLGDTVIIKRCTSSQLANAEIQMLHKLMHKTNPFPNFFMKLLYVHDVPNKYIDLVLQYGGEDLYQHCFQVLEKVHEPYSVTSYIKHISNIMSQVVACVVKLHALRYVHNDLKPENIVIDSDGKVTLIDFAIASTAQIFDPTLNLGCDGKKVGSEFYMHPHLLWNRPLASFYLNDLWAIGQTAFCLYTQTNIYNFETSSECEKNNILNLFLSSEKWHNHFPLPKHLELHESFPSFVAFVSKMCCLSKVPKRADMLLLQDKFLCYGT